MKKAITKVLTCFFLIVFLMSSFSVAVIASDSSNSSASNVSDLPVLNDTDISTAKTVSSLGYCSYVWIEITDKYCKGYEVYVDGVYQFTEGESGTPDGCCGFKVTPGYHTFKLTLNGKEVSKGWNCQCGTGYNWMSMNDMIPHWCEGGGGGNCDNPPTVNFDKSTYYEGDTVHATISTIHSSVYYKIKDCSGTVRKNGYVSNGESIYYTIPSGASECCYWTICFYWDEYIPPIALAGAGGEVTAQSYECSKCFSFYVCPHETPCKVWIEVVDKYCKGYKVYVDGVYQFTEGESGTPYGYCKFWVTPGTHKFELQKDGCLVSKSWYCQCGTYYSWVSMNDMYPRWCECNKPTPPPVKEVKFRGTVTDIRGTTPWVQVDTVISGSEYISVGDYTDIACYTTAGETGPCGHCDIAKKGDEVEVYGKQLPTKIPMVTSICGKASYYMRLIGKPDLVIEDIAWSPSNPKLGDNISFTVTVKNQGKGNAKKSHLFFGVAKKDENKFCFSRSSIIPSIAAGKTYTYTVNYDVTECGIYRIIANEDHWQEIEESDEDNNYREELLEIPCEIEKPDLTVTDFTLSPEHPKIGDTIKITFCITNEGKGVATENKASFVIANTSTKEILVNKTINLMDLNPKFGYCGGVNCIVKKCGTFSVIVSATTAHDSNLQNNTLAKKLEIECIREKPDLVIQDITWEPKNPKEGDRINLYVEVKNQGLGAAGAFDVSFSFVDGSYKDCNSVSMLSAGSTSIQTFTWTANKCGYIFISAKADVNNAIPESNEENNEEERILSVSCEKPDLTISAIKWSPSNPKEGDTITFDIDITNKGLGSAGNTYVIYYIDGSTIDYDFIPPLSAGSTSTQTFTWPANKCGDIKVTAIVDRDKIVTENDETNNERTETVNIICLYLEKIWITGPDEIKAGETHQWQAYGSYSDGSQKELTNQVSWTVDASDILQNIGNGKFKGLKGGEATLKIDYEGKSASKKVTVIEEENQPPKAKFTYEKDGLTVHFTSTSYDPDGDIETYSWFFGDGGTSNQKNPIHTYSSEGTYTVVLLVWDDKGKPGSDSEDITVTEPKVPIKVTVKNLNNYPLPGCGGSITVKAHTDIHGKSLEEGSASYHGGENDLTITLNVPKVAKSITVWQTPKIKDGVQEYWGAMAITSEKKNEYNFVRHTPWITSITINGKSPYNELIDLNSPGVQTFYVQVTNPQIVNRKVKVEAFLDRDEKTPWDFNSNDLQELAPKESKEFSFFYNKEQTEGIWRFRIVVGMYSLDNKYVVTDQHDWYLIVDKGLLDREFYLGITAQSYYVFISQDADEALDKTIGDTVELYNSLVIGGSEDVAKESLLQAIKDYDAVLGGLFEAYTSINDLIHFAENVQKILNNILIATDLQLIKRTDGYSNAEQYSSDLGSCDGIQERVKCWKSGDEEAIEDMLTEESQYLSFMRGFADSARGGGITIEVRQQLDDFSNSCSEQEDEVKHLYYELVNHDLDKYNDFKVKSNWYSKANP